MARKLRIQYEGAMYHVINRGNYRRDLFQSAGEADAFVETLKEGSSGWSGIACVIESLGRTRFRSLSFDSVATYEKIRTPLESLNWGQVDKEVLARCSSKGDR